MKTSPGGGEGYLRRIIERASNFHLSLGGKRGMKLQTSETNHKITLRLGGRMRKVHHADLINLPLRVKSSFFNERY